MKNLFLSIVLLIGICGCTDNYKIKDSINMKNYKGKIMVYKNLCVDHHEIVYKITFRAKDSIYTEEFATDLFFLFNEGDTIK